MAGGSGEDIEALRLCTRTGRPYGNDGFREALETDGG